MHCEILILIVDITIWICVYEVCVYTCYSQVFEKVKELLAGKEQVKMFVADFEPGAWRAMRDVFEGVRIHGCAFHFQQALYRRIQKEKLEVSKISIYMYIYLSNKISLSNNI